MSSADDINAYLEYFTDQLGAPPGMLLGIAMTESSYNPDTGTFRNVRNSLGATGLMQLKPVAIADIKRAFNVKINAYDPIWSIYGATLLFVLNYRYLVHYTEQTPDWNALIIAYNGGWTAGRYYMQNGTAPSKEGRNYLASVDNTINNYA